jgi:type IV pilus assembly PilN-like protein
MKLVRRCPAPLELDFSGRQPWPGALGWILLAVGLGVAGSEVANWRTGEGELAEREAIVERLRYQIRRADPAQLARPRSVSEQEVRPALRLAGQLSADWGAVLRDLATAEDDRLALLSLEVDAARGNVRFTGDAKSLAAVFEYLARLEATPSLAAAQLTSYERATVGTVELIRFNAAARWEGPQ